MTGRYPRIWRFYTFNVRNVSLAPAFYKVHLPIAIFLPKFN